MYLEIGFPFQISAADIFPIQHRIQICRALGYFVYREMFTISLSMSEKKTCPQKVSIVSFYTIFLGGEGGGLRNFFVFAHQGRWIWVPGIFLGPQGFVNNSTRKVIETSAGDLNFIGFLQTLYRYIRVYTASKKSFTTCLCMELNYPKYRQCRRDRGGPLNLKHVDIISYVLDTSYANFQQFPIK